VKEKKIISIKSICTYPRTVSSYDELINTFECTLYKLRLHYEDANGKVSNKIINEVIQCNTAV
jgi:hypothetical protein